MYYTLRKYHLSYIYILQNMLKCLKFVYIFYLGNDTNVYK